MRAAVAAGAAVAPWRACEVAGRLPAVLTVALSALGSAPCSEALGAACRWCYAFDKGSVCCRRPWRTGVDGYLGVVLGRPERASVVQTPPSASLYGAVRCDDRVSRRSTGLSGRLCRARTV